MKRKKLLILAIIMTLLFTACQANPTDLPTESPTNLVEKDTESTASVDEPSPTAPAEDTNEENGEISEGNSTETPAPTATPTPEPTPTPIPHEHAYTEGVTKEATCTENGYTVFTCDCGDTYTKAIEKVEHVYAEVEGSAVAVTCEADGKEADKACVCGELIVGEKIASTGHDFGEYKSDKNATYEADGTKTATCAVCGGTVTDKGSKLEKPKEPNLYGMEFEPSNPKVPQYCLEDTDVYFEPSFQSEVIGHLSINEEVKKISWASNGSILYPPYSGNEKPTDISWLCINYNGQNGYIPMDYVCNKKRDTSIELHPLYANYPLVDGSGSGIYYPYVKEWRYVYGSAFKLHLNPVLSEMNIYDGIDMNVIDVVTDSGIIFECTGNAYVTLDDKRGNFNLREIYYNGKLAYVSQFDTMWYE